jgi:hypothetical protein
MSSNRATCMRAASTHRRPFHQTLVSDAGRGLLPLIIGILTYTAAVFTLRDGIGRGALDPAPVTTKWHRPLV